VSDLPVSDLCVIFDVDGTLVDSEGLANQAFLDLLPGLNEPLHELIERNRGRRFIPVANELAKQAGVVLPADFENLYRTYVDTLFESRLQPIKNVSTMLAAMTLPFCAASNAPQRKIRKALQVTGLLPFFDERIFSAYDVNAWKPAPDLFLHTAKTMGYAPAHCVVIEDSDVGMQAALAANMTVLYFSPTGAPSVVQPTASFAGMTELLPLLEVQRERRRPKKDGDKRD
jgi:HAD superfamily hydrolase (TIGR01509 family)